MNTQKKIKLIRATLKLQRSVCLDKERRRSNYVNVFAGNQHEVALKITIIEGLRTRVA